MNMDMIRQEIIETGRFIVEKGLTWGTSGNISVREENNIYITASGTVLGDLRKEDILICDLDGNVIEGEKKPSKETSMHCWMYQKRADISAIVHASPFYSTMCACIPMQLKTNLFIESMYYDSDLGRIPYFPAGSRELAEAAAEACGNSHVILMEHHGILAADTSLKECRAAVEVTENMCKMNLLSGMGGFPLTEVEPDAVREFLERGYYKKKR